MPLPNAFAAESELGDDEDSRRITSNGRGSSITTSDGENISTGEYRHAIPWAQIGAKAGAEYDGRGLAVSANGNDARLNCVFQRLQGHVTPDGLWLESTAEGQARDRFQVKALTLAWSDIPQTVHLSATGNVFVDGKSVHFARSGLAEEYSVSVDGLRQDFVVTEKPTMPFPNTATSNSELRVELTVSGARVDETIYGARLVLEKSGRKIAYSRLRVTDLRGRELPARMEVIEQSRGGTQDFAGDLAVIVNDSNAVYPVRIDPTFSDANWISIGALPGADNFIRAVVTDGSGNLYVGGQFSAVGDAVVNRIARWNGTEWSALGSGMNNTVWALAISGGDLYAAGQFTTAGGVAATNIAKWNGSSWSALDSGITSANSTVFALAVSGNDLYAGGLFTIGGIAATNIAKWNGSNWAPVGSGLNSTVSALAVSGDNVYAGGAFTKAGAASINNVARWDGNTWDAVGLGMNAAVSALTAVGNEVYAGGTFLRVTNTGNVSVSVNRIAKWDGTNWSALGTGLNGAVRGLAMSGTNLYAAGDFTTLAGGGPSFGYIARWNGSAWSALGSGVTSNLYAVTVVGNDVYACGNFRLASGVGANSIARWDGNAWNAVGPAMTAMNGDVRALAVSDTDLYAAGAFTSVGGITTTNIARWNGTTWSALGSGLPGNYVSALAILGTNLYAGGQFSPIAGSQGIARWNGSSWSGLGSGVTGLGFFISALAVSGTNLYVGGNFTSAGGVARPYIARWNGSAWSSVGSGMDGPVYSLTVLNSNVYAGGLFTAAGGVPASRVAKWDETTWSALGSGMDSLVWALASSGSNVYAGGSFTTAGSVTVNYIAKWDGSNWSALGNGLNNAVIALAASGNEVYAGGYFSAATNLGGVAIPASYVARWDGNSWSALGSGANGPVNALAIWNGNPVAGGAFSIMGDKVCAAIAKAELGSTPPGYNVITPELLSGGQMRISYLGMANSSYALDRTFNLSAPITWVPQSTNLTDPNGSLVVTNTPVSTTNNFWRVRFVDP